MKKLIFTSLLFALCYAAISQKRLDVAGDALIQQRLEVGNNIDGNMLIGRNAGINIIVGFPNPNSGKFNTFLGNSAGRNNISGNNNTFVGIDAGNSNQNGSFNTIVGSAAGFLTTGFDNTIVGAFAGNINQGVRNTFIGAGSGFQNNGFNNVYLGNQTGHDNFFGSDNIFIGNQAGFFETGSSLLFIENSNSSTPLIYGDFAMDTVRINGTFQIGTTLTFPNTDGTSGQVLTTDGNGILSWSSIGGSMTTNETSAKKEVIIQAQQAEIEALNERIESLEQRFQRLESTLNKPNAVISSTSQLTEAKLFDNQPNPFSESTTLRYFIPESVQQAALRITNASGEHLKVIAIAERGQGQTTLEAHALSAGSYFYTLILDGKVSETKQMVLVE